MAIVATLPGSNQSAFEQAVRAAQKRRGEGSLPSEAELLSAMTMFGGPTQVDPFPIGMQFSNQQPVAPPLTKAERELANMREVQRAAEAKKQAGMDQYGEAVASTVAPIQALRARGIEQGVTGIDENKRAEYLARVATDKENRNKALAAVTQMVGSQQQQSPLQTLQEFRDPEGAFRRRMAMEAMGLRRDALAGEREDRASSLGLQREGLSQRERMHGNTLEAQRQSGESEKDFRLRMTEMEQRLLDKREGRAVERESGRESRDAEREKQRLDAQQKMHKDEMNLRKQGIETPKQKAKAAAYESELDTITKFEAEGRVTRGEANRRRDDALRRRLGKGGDSTAVPVESEPRLAKNQINQQLLMEWDSVGLNDDKSPKAILDVLRDVPLEDIKNNKDEFRKWLELRFPGKDLDDLFSSGSLIFDNESAALFNRVRKVYGLNPNQTTMGRTWGLGIPGLGDLIFGPPE